MTPIHWHGRFRQEWTIGGQTYVDFADNQLYDQGEQDILESFFRGASAPTDFKIGMLKTSYSILETHTMTQVAAAELSPANCGGYAARQVLTRDSSGWPTSALDAGDWRLVSAQVTWEATAPWTETAGFMFIMSGGVTTPANTTGRIIAVAPMNPTRQLQAALDTLKISYYIKLQ